MPTCKSPRFFKAIKDDDSILVSEILSSLSATDKQYLMNSKLIFSDLRRFPSIPTHKVQFKRPFTLALVYGSLKVCDVMIQNDVDVCLVEVGSYNVIHCLVCIAFYQPYSEEAVVKTYRSLCRMLSKDILRKLLQMEEAYGLRPLEFAAQQGTLQLMSAIFETPGIYIVREEIVGVSVYQWYDVTEYENADGSESRYSKSPLLFLARIDQRHLENPCVCEILTNGVVADWITAMTDSNKNKFVYTGLFHRVLYTVALTVYEMDSSWLGYTGRAVSDQETNGSNATDVKDANCGNGSVVFMSRNVLQCLEAFLLFTSISFIFINIWFFANDARSYLGWGTHVNHRDDLNGKKCLVVSSMDFLSRPLFDILTCVLAIMEVFIRHTGSQDVLLIAVVSFMRAVSPFCLHMSITFFLQATPGIGHLLICLRKIYWDFVLGAITIEVFVTAFAHFNMVYFGANGRTKCVDEFSDFVTAFYTLFLTMINAQGYDQFDVLYAPIMYIGNVLYVCAVGILLVNLMIAMFSDTISKVSERKTLELKLCQLLTYAYLEEGFSKLPFHRKLFNKAYTALSKIRNFNEKGRIFIIHPKTNNKPIGDLGLHVDHKDLT